MSLGYRIEGPETAPVLVLSNSLGTTMVPSVARLNSATTEGLSWRMASTNPRNPPAAPACPTDNCPPDVLSGSEPPTVTWPAPLGPAEPAA